MIRRGCTALAAGLAVAAACARELPLPSESELQGRYGPGAAVRLSGNVVEVVVVQPREHVERGGRLWVRVGPYIYLFTPETRDLFERYGGIAAVRAITRLPSGEEIARATLRRDALNQYTWPRALHLAGIARVEGTSRPRALEDLIHWGEEHTEFRYTHP